MIRSIDEEEDIENSFKLVLRNKEYKKEIYQINEEIKHNKNMYKLYGYNKERNLNVVITKIINISLKENPNFEKRLLITIKLIEENKLLVENLWVEKTNSNKYNLYISELTNSIYRNEYNLITLNNYMNSTQNTYKENIEILIAIVQKMLYFQSFNFSHLNIHPNNIYINIKKNNLIYFGPPKLVKKYTNDCTYLWYSSPEENYLENEIWENSIFGIYNDIWSLGCITCEMFFINFPLFQSYSSNEKIIKIFEILGFPDYEDVDYMNQSQYNSFLKKKRCNSKENNLTGFLLSSKEEHSNLYNFKIELIEIINGCLTYNRANRMSLEEILKKLEYLNSNISTEFQSKVMYTIINSEESENNHYMPKNNYKLKNNKKNITKSNSIESDEDKDLDNNINLNDYKYSYINNNNNKINTVRITDNDDIYNNKKKLTFENKKENNKAKSINYYQYSNIDINEKIPNKEDNKNKNKEINYMKSNKIKHIEEIDEYKELQKSKSIIFIIYFL
jgi:hypothetical protein